MLRAFLGALPLVFLVTSAVRAGDPIIVSKFGEYHLTMQNPSGSWSKSVHSLDSPAIKNFSRNMPPSQGQAIGLARLTVSRVTRDEKDRAFRAIRERLEECSEAHGGNMHCGERIYRGTTKGEEEIAYRSYPTRADTLSSGNIFAWEEIRIRYVQAEGDGDTWFRMFARNPNSSDTDFADSVDGPFRTFKVERTRDSE